MINLDVTVALDLICRKCKSWLTGTVRSHRTYYDILVNPCEYCIDRAKKDITKEVKANA